MGRGRAPCCAKVGLNKGSWAPEEDVRLIAYIHKYGHGNWRALPKLAGLLRCGKSCRLRWINYLRPDIKRGNFTREEEDTIIRLHGILGNKWSKIAACLPGRTDNEIKNVWNTHLKKRLKAEARKKSEEQPSSPSSITTASVSCSDDSESRAEKKQGEANAEEEQNKAMEEEINRIEIPIEPNSDFWDMLQVDEPSSSSDPLLDLPDISPIEHEIWDMINNDLDIAPPNESTTASTDIHQRSSGATANSDAESSHPWLQYLEQELDLWGESSGNIADIVEGGGDPVASYFQTLQSSRSPLDPLY